MYSIEELKDKLNEVENQIAEVKKRLPAHSVKPPIMMELLSLEDQKDEIVAQLEKKRMESAGT